MSALYMQGRGRRLHRRCKTTDIIGYEFSSPTDRQFGESLPPDPPRHYLYGIHHIDICFEGRCTNKYIEMGIGYNIHLPNALY